MLKKLLGDYYDNSIATLIKDGVYGLYSLKNNTAKFLLCIPQQKINNFFISQTTISIFTTIPAVNYLLDAEGNILGNVDDTSSLELIKPIRNFPEDFDYEETTLSKEELEQLIKALEL